MLKRIIFTAFLCFSVSVSAWETPREAISEFLKFELGGGRLSSDGWKIYISKYIDAPEGYMEPGWDMVTVATEYKIKTVECSSPTTCIATVDFTLYPTENLKSPHVIEHKRGGKEQLKYELINKNKGWLIQPSMGAPIISLETYHKHMKRIAGKPVGWGERSEPQRALLM